MADIEQRFAAIRQEIDRLRTALQTSVDDAERHQLHARLNECIRESIRLVDQRLQPYATGRTDPALLLERQVGDSSSE